MELCHTDSILDSPAAQQLTEFIQKQREKWAGQQADLSAVEDFEGFEQELHTLVMALECEMISAELGRYNIGAKEIEVDGKVYSRSIGLPETYLTAAGRITVERYLYHPADHPGKCICPLELRSGIIAGYFSPRAARQGAYVMAHLTPGESEELFGEIGNM